MNTKKSLAALLMLFVSACFLGAQTSPEAFLGYKVGADRKLADYEQIQGYFQKLDQESAKLKVLTIGQTTLKKPMIMAVITSEKNMNDLDKYRQIAKRLSQARGLSPDDARKLARDGKVIVFLTCALHAAEIGSSQAAMELAYRLVKGDTPFDAAKVLDDVILLLVPSANPDGQLMITDWYRKNLGTNFEGGPMPWLYHHYAGHDDNRDYALNLVETRAVADVMIRDWFPQIYFDQHQTSMLGVRCFVPPFIDPADPDVHPLLFSGTDLIGANMAYDLEKEGLKGVVHARNYASAWFKGAHTGIAEVHNIVSGFSEMASVKIATPIYIDRTQLNRKDQTAFGDVMTKSLTLPDPWEGGWWRFRDIVDYNMVVSLSLVESAYLHKEDWLFNNYKMSRDAIEAGTKGGPFAFVVPQEQFDYPTALRMLDVLKFGGAEIYQATEAFAADGRAYPAGAFVIPASQPYRPFVMAMLDERKYPDIFIAPKLRDNAGHTYPLQMGVSFSRIVEPFAAKLAKLEKISHPTVSYPSSPPYIVLDSRANASYAVAAALIGQNAEVYRTRDVVRKQGLEAAAGSFVIRNTAQVQKIAPALLDKWHLSVRALGEIADIPKDSLRTPLRVGLYQSWRANPDEGWTRFIFDDFGIPYTTLHNADFQGAKAKPAGLRERFDVIVFADEDPAIIKSGSQNAEYPPEYRGGIGAEGIEALGGFVEQGGVLVGLNEACQLFIKELGLPARDVMEGVPESKFFCPKSLLRIKVDNASSIGYGMPGEAAAMFGGDSEALAFETRIPGTGDWGVKVVAGYPENDLLLRGGLIGEDLIARRAAVVDVRHGKGNIILIGFPCQHRAQTQGTYKFLFNALLYPATD